MVKKIDGKSLIKSKTFWFNSLTLLVAVASLFGYQDYEPNAEVSVLITSVVAIVNVILRIKTTKSITTIK